MKPRIRAVIQETLLVDTGNRTSLRFVNRGMAGVFGVSIRDEILVEHGVVEPVVARIEHDSLFAAPCIRRRLFSSNSS